MGAIGRARIAVAFWAKVVYSCVPYSRAAGAVVTDEWFHKRSNSEGTGYSVKGRKGLIASIILILLIIVVVIGATEASITFHTPPLATLLVAMGIVAVMIFAFVALAMIKNDAR